MSDQVQVIFLKNEDKCVVFTDMNSATAFCEQNQNVKGYIADLNPPIFWRYAITFGTEKSGFTKVSLEAKYPYTDQPNIIMVSYSGEWTVYVKATDEAEAVALAKSEIVKKLIDLYPKEEEEDDWSSDCVYSNSLT